MNVIEIINAVKLLTNEYDSATILRFLPAFQYLVEYEDFEKVYVEIESWKHNRRRHTNVKHPTYSFDNMYNTVIKYKECVDETGRFPGYCQHRIRMRETLALLTTNQTVAEAIDPSTKVSCGCGGAFATKGTKGHEKTKKHMNWMKSRFDAFKWYD